MRQAALIARKDLLVEWRSRVTLNQVVPLALLILVVFAFAFDANQALLDQGAPGLFWVGVLFAGVLTVQRAFTIESTDGITDASDVRRAHSIGHAQEKIAHGTAAHLDVAARR